MPAKGWKKDEHLIETYKFEGSGLSEDEVIYARTLFEQYKSDYRIASFSELRLLNELVYRETRQEYFKKQKKFYTEMQKDTKKRRMLFKRYSEVMNKNLEMILLLKDKLGLFRDEQTKEDPLKYIEILREKFKRWCEMNQGSRTFCCPGCSRMLMFIIRPEMWKLQKYTYFKDKHLYREHLWKIWKEDKITKDDVASVLGVTPDYVQWIDDNIEKNLNQNKGENRDGVEKI